MRPRVAGPAGESWPYCEDCRSYHHPDNPTCRTTKPRLMEEWSDLGNGLDLGKPLNPGWGYGKRWYDSRDDWDDEDEAEDEAWEGSMSEDKAKYTPGDTITVGSQETIEAIPSRLPTLLAQMVNEYSETLNTVFVTNDEAVILQFNEALLAAANSALRQYFEALANPPMAVHWTGEITSESLTENEVANLLGYTAYLKSTPMGAAVDYPAWKAGRS